MSKCLECGSELPENGTVCLQCGRVSSLPGLPPAPFPRQANIREAEVLAAVDAWKARREAETLKCLRCETPLQWLGTRTFDLAGGWDGIGGLLEDLLEPRPTLELHFCPHCGKVEFFLPDIGRSHR